MSYRFSFWRLVGTAGVVSLIGSWLFFGSFSWACLPVPTMIFIVGIPMFLMMGVYGGRFFRFVVHGACALVFEPQAADAGLAQMALFGSRCVVGGAAITMLIELIELLRNLSSPEDISAGIALALAAPLYGLLLSELFFAFVHQSFAVKREATAEAVLPLKYAGIVLVVVFFVLAVFVLPLLSFAAAGSGLE